MAIEILNDRPSLQRYRCNKCEGTYFFDRALEILFSHRLCCPKCGEVGERIK